jgi:type VI secretion system protein ImpJ
MKSLERPVWSEGMLLSPQHLQSLDRAIEALVAARLGALAAVDFGVLAVDWDAAALAKGELRLLRFEGILPDGLPVAFDTPELGPPPRALAERFGATARSLEVFLAVPRERAGVPSYAEEGASSPTRYLTLDRPMEDAGAAGPAVPVRLARPRAILLLGEEPREDHECLKVAELVRRPGGQIALAESFVPPCLKLAASPYLLAALRELLASLIARQRALMERHRELSSEVTGPVVTRLLQLLVVNGHLPALSLFAESGEATPRECFLALCELAARLGAFTGEDPTTLPKFEHRDLRGSFEPLFSRLKPLVAGVGAQRYLVVPLEQRPGGVYLARIQDERILRGQLYLSVASDQPESAVADQLPRLCKIASASEIQGLVQANAPGLPLRVNHRPPPELPVKAGSLYFELVPGDRYWKNIVAARNVAFYLPPPFDPARTRLDLFALPGEGGEPRSPSRP